MTQKKDIFELALELSKNQLHNQLSGDTSLIFAGSKNGGKTGIIYRFLERSETPKPTLALEYSYARKQKASGAGKDVCNIWELGGGTLFTNLLDFAITSQNLLSSSLIIVIDLSVPEELIITTETLLGAVKDRISDILSYDNGITMKEILKEKAMKRIGENFDDRDRIELFPIPLIIIGSKYDTFQDFDPEKKKLIVRYLRLIAHLNGAQLIFVSTSSETLITKARVAFSHLAFGTSASITASYDYNKPIVIPFGGDSFESIEHNNIESVKQSFTSIFPQSVTKHIIPDDPAKDINFKERDIDLLRAQKDNELEEYKRQIEIRHHSMKMRK